MCEKFIIFWYVLVSSTYISSLKQFQPWEVASVVGSIVVRGGVLTHCTLLHCVGVCDLKATLMDLQHIVVGDVLTHCTLLHCVGVCDLKATLMDLQHSPIQELMLHKFEQSYNASESNQNKFDECKFFCWLAYAGVCPCV